MRKGICIFSAVVAFLELSIYIPLQQCNYEAAPAYGKTSNAALMEGLLVGGIIFLLLLFSIVCISAKKIIFPILLSVTSIILIVIMIVAKNVPLMFVILIHLSAGLFSFFDIYNSQGSLNQQSVNSSSIPNSQVLSNNNLPIKKYFQNAQQQVEDHLSTLKPNPSPSQFTTSLIWETSNKRINKHMAEEALSLACKEFHLDYELLDEFNQKELHSGNSLYYRKVLVFSQNQAKLSSSFSNYFQEYYYRNMFKQVLKEG